MPEGSPRILVLDIETSPSLAHVWSLHNVNVGLSQLMKPTEVLCFAAKWYGEKDMLFASSFHDGYEEMVRKAHALLDEADVVVHYNGDSFDLKHLNREFAELSLAPPSPYQSVDLYKTVKNKFRFASSKLDHVAKQLGLGGKVSHTGHELWVSCLKGDEAAWALMKKYNQGDVRLTERLYERLLPWLKSSPHLALLRGAGEGCQRCGSGDLEKRGYAYTGLGAFERFRCKACGSWSRGAKRVASVEIRAI